MAACGSAEDADRVQTQKRAQLTVRCHPVDGLADLDRAPGPARRARLCGVLVVVTRMLRYGHREAPAYENARQIDMDPWRTSGAMRDDDESAVAANGPSRATRKISSSVDQSCCTG